MRPMILTMSAFGSYADCVTIDFGQVQQGVFLITGDTGAGKTTIFDGITYALYGQTSGGRRDGTMMRSQYAPSGTKTYVDLTFSNGGQVWRVLRSPEYERESKRRNKDGERTMTKERGSVELYQPDGSLYPGTRQEVNRKLVEILGVDARQFMQIAMIAQGDFLRLLLAKSDERKEIFSRIFDTRIFGRVQEELKNRSKRCYGELEDNRKLCLREIEQLEVSESTAQEKEELLRTGQKEPDLEAVLAFAERLLEEEKAQYEQSQKEMKKTTAVLEKLNQRYSVEKERAQSFAKLAQLEKRLGVLEAEREEKDQEKERIGAAKRAAKVETVYAGYREAAESKKRAKMQEKQLEGWLEERKAETGKLKEKEETWSSYVKKLEEKEVPVLERLRQALEQYGQLQSHLKEAERLEKHRQQEADRYRRADRAYRQQAERYEALYQEYLAGQAGILAAQLKENVPCPVCGSLHHPSPAKRPLANLSQELVEKERERRNQAENDREACRQKYQETENRYQQEMAVIREQQMRLLQREQNEEENLEVMKNRWEEWEEKARKRLKDGEEKLQVSKKELDRATQSLQKFLQEENRKKGQLEEVQRQCEIFKEQEKEKRTAYEAMRSEQQFETEEDFQNACMKPAELERREKALEAYEEQLRQSRQEVDWLRQQLKGKETPDLAQTESELKEQKEQQRMQERELRKLYSRRETNQQAVRKLQQLTKEREELRKRYQVLNTLSRTANGSLAGTAKIDLESYMQRQYFQQMIRCANRHLERMAAGQFLLKCRRLENLSTQGNAGLDLDVYSLITGKVRDVKTLSGGESFMAALALALGMTDVITQAVGAVHIDTLFIDEGFGSLDENAREQAIRILQGLSGGSRLVGIISHVTELKEQIEQKLVVTKGKSGSKVEWK